MDVDEIIKKNRTLAVIFKPDLESKELIIHSFAMIEKEKETDIYCKIISGEFAGFSDEDFNEMQFISMDNPFFEQNFREMFIYNEYNIDDYLIFEFDPLYILEVAEERGISYDLACLFIAKHCCDNTIKFDCSYKNLDFSDVNNIQTINYNLVEGKNIISNADILKMIDVEPEPLIIDEVKVDENKPFKMSDVAEKDLLKEMVTEISKKIVGQENAIITLVSNILLNQKIIDQVCSDDTYDAAELDSQKISILLDGPTGTGKTAILKDIASRLNLPLCICNSNSFSETGYVGASITDILRRLYFLSGKNIKVAERSIVVLDEIDKLASKASFGGRDMKEGVQEELLGFMSGGTYDVLLEDKFGAPTIQFDTSKLTYILSGAFTDLRERKIKENEKKYKGIGFNSTVGSNYERTYTIDEEDYIIEGLKKEFFGRIKVLAHTKEYDFDGFMNILLRSTISPLKNFQKTASYYGYYDVDYTKEFLECLCNRALKVNTGARALQSIMSGIQNLMLYDIQLQNYDLDKPLDLNPELIEKYNKSLVRNYTLK